MWCEVKELWRTVGEAPGPPWERWEGKWPHWRSGNTPEETGNTNSSHNLPTQPFMRAEHKLRLGQIYLYSTYLNIFMPHNHLYQIRDGQKTTITTKDHLVNIS